MGGVRESRTGGAEGVSPVHRDAHEDKLDEARWQLRDSDQVARLVLEDLERLKQSPLREDKQERVLPRAHSAGGSRPGGPGCVKRQESGELELGRPRHAALPARHQP
eukprot:4262934-Lingulodinium_polyedra.AAC.1